MPIETTAPSASQASAHKASFFRQSGWLMIATVIGGLFMYLIHPLAKKIGPTEYGLFGALLAMVMCIPTMPLQMVMAQQTAQALAADRRRELAGIFRLAMLSLFVVWVIGTVVLLAFQNVLLKQWGATSPASFWVTLPALLLALWLPAIWGVLQGKQDFLWLGWSQIFNGIVRVGVAVLCVMALHAGVPGMMLGVVLGFVIAVGVAGWQARDLWHSPVMPTNWKALLGQIIPLMLGFGAFQFMFTADTMFVKSYFPSEETGFYFSAGTLSRALMWMVGPMAAVMFPKLVHSAVRSEKTDLMGIVLLGTAVLAILGSVAVSLLGPFIITLIYGKTYTLVASAVLPWYAGAMVPLALANVLLNNLMARSRFGVVIPLCLIVAGYCVTIMHYHETLVGVLKILGGFNLLVLASCCWFNWRTKAPVGQAAV